MVQFISRGAPRILESQVFPVSCKCSLIRGGCTFPGILPKDSAWQGVAMVSNNNCCIVITD